MQAKKRISNQHIALKRSFIKEIERAHAVFWKHKECTCLNNKIYKKTYNNCFNSFLHLIY